jgi:hypothetical protein
MPIASRCAAQRARPVLPSRPTSPYPASGVHRRVCCCSAHECSAHQHRRHACANDRPAVKHAHRLTERFSRRAAGVPPVFTAWVRYAGAYVFGESGSNRCPAGSITISTAAACEAAAAATALAYDGREYESGYPAGCYRVTDGDSIVFFNAHVTGGSDANSQPLCSPEGSACTPLPSTWPLSGVGSSSARLLLQRPPTSATHARPRQPGPLSRLLRPHQTLRLTTVTLPLCPHAVCYTLGVPLTRALACAHAQEGAASTWCMASD